MLLELATALQLLTGQAPLAPIASLDAQLALMPQLALFAQVDIT